jgi:prepilin-type N-terminal cleavage/methylation domain-containing protein/prepilin-type processing-associated H-X9-DG protein
MTYHHNTRRSATTRRAFTLIELLVVIAIIAILAAILFPVFAQAKKAAKITGTISNMKQMALSSKIYAGDYDDVNAMTIASLITDPSTCGWGNEHTYIGHLQMVYPYAKNVDVFNQGVNPWSGGPRVQTPVDPSGTWGDWTKEETILPGAVALNQWNPNGCSSTSGNSGDIAPRSDTSVPQPANTAMYAPWTGEVTGKSTIPGDPTLPQIDWNPYYETCWWKDTVGAGGETGLHRAFTAHNRSMPLAFFDGHVGKVKANAFFESPDTACTGFGNFQEGEYANTLWGWFFDGIPVTHQ